MPALTHAAVFNKIFHEYTDALAKCKKAGSFVPFLEASRGKGGSVNGKDGQVNGKDGQVNGKDGQVKGKPAPPPPPLHAVGIDLKAMLNNGFAVPFSKKREADAPSQLAYRKAYCNGLPVVIRDGAVPNPKPFKPDTPHDLAVPEGAPGHLRGGDARYLLYQGCYTVPKGYLASVSPHCQKFCEGQRNRTAARSGAHHAASGGGVPPPRGAAPDMSEHHLPAWLQSALSQRGAVVIRRDAAKTYLSHILKIIPALAPSLRAVHVSGAGMPCPCSLAQSPPVEHYHHSNGIILAYSPDPALSTVYTRCTQCTMNVKEVGEGVTLLTDAAGKATQWVELTEAAFKSLVQQAKQGLALSRSLPASVSLCLCLVDEGQGGSMSRKIIALAAALY